MALSKQETEQLKELFEQCFDDKLQTTSCPYGMDQDTVDALKKVAPALEEHLPSLEFLTELKETSKKTLRKIIIATFILGIIAIFLTGMWWHVKHLIDKIN